MEINEFVSKKRMLISFVLIALFILYIIIHYIILAFTPVKYSLIETNTLERGSIMDRNGKPLALQVNFYHLSANPTQIGDVERASEILAPLLDMPQSEIAEKLTTSDRQFVYIKKKMDESEYDIVSNAIEENKLSGLSFEQVMGRMYPENALASQLIGFMGDDGIGLAGIEYSMQHILMPQNTEKQTGITHGKNIYLTIDANLQYKLEQIARESMSKTKAASMMILAAEAKTGEILSYISLPASNLNEYPASTPAEKIDRPAMTAYEPGSVFKIFSVASFIDTKSISETDTFVCDGVYEIHTTNGEHVRITCLDHHGSETPRDALKYSCNDALAQMSEHIDSNLFISKLRAFGFGDRTGIELPGETAGSVKSVGDKLWSGRSKPTISIGQEISVSALQMIQAASAFSNGGIPIKPTVISKITDYNGTVEYQHTPVYKERVISPYTADYLRSCMFTTAESGTGSRAALGDINIGVKTGTAQMADTEHGGYSTTDFLSNCIALFPIENPQIILYIVIEKAQGETYSGRIVAPVIGQAADVIIDHLGIQRGDTSSFAHSGSITLNHQPQITLSDTVPDFTGVSKRMVLPLLERDDINFILHGDGWVVSQSPVPGTPVTENMTIELYFQ